YGRVGQAFLFGDDGGYLVGPTTARDPFGYRDSTFLGYVKFAAKHGENTILDRWAPETRFSTHLWKSSEDRIIFDFGMPAEPVRLVSRTVVGPERWYHVAFTTSDGELALYINGVVEDQQAIIVGPTAAPQAPLFLGGTHNGKRLFKGKMDEML